MKRLLQYTLCCFFALSNICYTFAADDTAKKQADRDSKARNYSKRRYYTKRIDLFDADETSKLKVPAEKAPKLDDGLGMDKPSLPTRDISSRITMPRLPAPAKPQQDDNNWLVNALMQKDEEDNSLDFTADDPTDSNWGWLARDADLTRQQQTQDERDIAVNQNSSYEDEDKRMPNSHLDRSGGDNTIQPLFIVNEEQPEGRQIFRDHHEEERQRYEIFKSLEDGNDKHVNRFENSEFASESDNNENFQSLPNYYVDTKAEDKYKSAFDDGMRSKLRSPFKSTYESPASSASDATVNNNNSSYELPYSPPRPESDGYTSNYAPMENDRGLKPLGGSDKFEVKKKELPYSVHQWK